MEQKSLRNTDLYLHERNGLFSNIRDRHLRTGVTDELYSGRE